MTKMAKKLTQIIKDDLSTTGKLFGYVAGSVASSVAKGLIRGIYTPFLMNTGMRQLHRNYRDIEDSVILDGVRDENLLQDMTHAAIAISVCIPPIMYAFIGEDVELKYLGLGVLTTTNVIDYLANVYRRSKEQDIQDSDK